MVSVYMQYCCVLLKSDLLLLMLDLFLRFLLEIDAFNSSIIAGALLYFWR